jgi:S-DNA-T family DNA segregation ATPase FtsK/SpoIIIE
MWAVVVLAWMSLLSYSPTDYGDAWVYPAQSTQNAAGEVGAAVAHVLRYWLGAGSYVGLLFTTLAAGVLICGGRVGEWPWRVIGTTLLIAAVSTGAYLHDPQGAVSIANGSAGVLGHGAGEALIATLHTTGGWWVVFVAAAIGLMFTADAIVLWVLTTAPKGAAGVAARARQRLLEHRQAKAAVKAKAPALTRPKPTPQRAERPAPRPTIHTPKPVPAAPAKPPVKKHTSAVGPAGRKGKQAVLPSADLLVDAEQGYIQAQEASASQKQQILQQTLNDFNVQAEVVGYQTGPVITMFELSLAPGVKVAQIASLHTDIDRSLAVSGVRVVPHLAGRDTIGIEVPNDDKEIVRLKDLMQLAPDATERMYLPLFLGKDAGGDPITADLAAMPHMLIAGTTGSGKSVCINSIIMSLLLTRRPQDVKLILADPKMVEMAAFDGLPHLLCPIVNDMRKAESILEWAVTQMDQRYDLLKEAGVKNIAGFNHLTEDELYERLGIEDEA